MIQFMFAEEGADDAATIDSLNLFEINICPVFTMNVIGAGTVCTAVFATYTHAEEANEIASHH